MSVSRNARVSRMHHASSMRVSQENRMSQDFGLYQGMTLVVPNKLGQAAGFSPCKRKTSGAKAYFILGR
jgi:hypothetical protein